MDQRTAPVNLYLKPGEACFCEQPAIVSTVLGSCISVTIHHPVRRVGAICHAVLPQHNEHPSRKKDYNPLEYVDTSILWMMEQFNRRGIRQTELVVKMFGGAGMFAAPMPRLEGLAVGRKNIEMGMATLEDQKLRLTSWNVGGRLGRKLVFHTYSGDVFQKFLRRTDG